MRYQKTKVSMGGEKQAIVGSLESPEGHVQSLAFSSCLEFYLHYQWQRLHMVSSIWEGPQQTGKTAGVSDNEKLAGLNLERSKKDFNSKELRKSSILFT